MEFPRFNYHENTSCCKGPKQLFDYYGNYGAVNIVENKSTGTLESKCLRNRTSCQFTALTPSLPLFPVTQTVKYPYKDSICGNVLEEQKRIVHVRKRIRSLRKSTCASSIENYREIKSLQEKLHIRNSLDDGVKVPHFLSKVLTHYRDIRNIHRVPLYNVKYSGSLISSTRWTSINSNVLFYTNVNQSEFHKLFLTAIDAREDGLVSFDVKKTIYPRKSIFQVDARDYHGLLCLAARSMNSVDLWLFSSSRAPLNHEVIFLHSAPTSITLSPFIAGEVVISEETGDHSLFSGADCVFTTKTSSDHLQRYSSHFGAHPRQMFIADKYHVRKLDVRMKNCEPKSFFEMSRDMFDSKEEIINTCRLSSHDFLHLVSSDFHLLMLDERFSKSPVLTWQHMLLSPAPYLCSLGNLVGSDIILLASQNPPETCCFQCCTRSSSEPPTDLDNPWKLSNISDFAHFPENNGAAGSEIIKERFDVSLAGISVAGSTRGSQSLFTALQMDCHGDIFYQTFSDKDHNSDKTMSLGPGSSNIRLKSDIVRKCRDWLSSIQADSLFSKSSSCPTKPSSNSSTILPIIQVLRQKPVPNPDCTLCYPKMTPHSSHSGTDAICPACGQSIDLGNRLHDNIPKGLSSTREGQVDEICTDIDQILTYDDPDGMIVQSLWSGNLEDLSNLMSKREVTKRTERAKLLEILPDEDEIEEADEGNKTSQLQPKFDPVSFSSTGSDISLEVVRSGKSADSCANVVEVAATKKKTKTSHSSSDIEDRLSPNVPHKFSKICFTSPPRTPSLSNKSIAFSTPSSVTKSLSREIRTQGINSPKLSAKTDEIISPSTNLNSPISRVHTPNEAKSDSYTDSVGFPLTDFLPNFISAVRKNSPIVRKRKSKYVAGF